MRKSYMVTLLTACFLSACGGSGDSSPPNPSPETAKRFVRQISFGDSLSDVGTYAVGKVKELGGGKFTINGNNTQVSPALTGQIWVEQLAQKLDLAAPCAAQTGLDGNAAMGYSVPVVDHAGCFAYAQGGARVTNPVGPLNKAAGHDLGALTVPVKTQISRHLALSDNKFHSDELVLVMAGGNDLLFELGQVQDAAGNEAKRAIQQATDIGISAALASGATDPAAATAAILQAVNDTRASSDPSELNVLMAAIGVAAQQPGNGRMADPAVYLPLLQPVPAASVAAGELAAATYVLDKLPALNEAMSTAGRELADLVKHEILAKGAQHVVVNNMPDLSQTPTGRDLGPLIQPFLQELAKAFNEQLKPLEDEARVALVDVYKLTQDIANSPVTYGLTNVTGMACDLSDEKNSLESALICSASNLNAVDVSHYAYADDLHPTPYLHGVLAAQVEKHIKEKGWH